MSCEEIRSALGLDCERLQHTIEAPALSHRLVAVDSLAGVARGASNAGRRRAKRITISLLVRTSLARKEESGLCLQHDRPQILLRCT